VQAFLPSVNISNPDSNNLGWVLIGFSFAMVLGSLLAWAWIPEVQDSRGSDTDIAARRESSSSGGGARKGRWRTGPRSYAVPSKSLEELALGRRGVVDEQSGVGLRVRGRAVLDRMDNTARKRRARNV
jgi:PHS family inorganic phosphate transporter-like MFS transporter